MYTSPEIVIGFHGCDQKVADSVIKYGGDLLKSDNDYDWLGNGIYFWEGSNERALSWARNHPKVDKPAVVGAFIKLGNCLDLLDSKHLGIVEKTYDILNRESKSLNRPLPKNKVLVDDISFVRELDCKVITLLQTIRNEAIAKQLGLSDIDGQSLHKVQHDPHFYDSVRGMFPEGKELYEGAGFRVSERFQFKAHWCWKGLPFQTNGTMKWNRLEAPFGWV